MLVRDLGDHHLRHICMLLLITRSKNGAYTRRNSGSVTGCLQAQSDKHKASSCANEAALASWSLC